MFLSQGFETAKKATLQFLETFKDKVEATDRELLLCVARTSLRTKLYQDLADQLTDIVVDAVLTIRKEDEPLDLYMVSFASSLHSICPRTNTCAALQQQLQEAIKSPIRTVLNEWFTPDGYTQQICSYRV